MVMSRFLDYEQESRVPSVFGDEFESVMSDYLSGMKGFFAFITQAPKHYATCLHGVRFALCLRSSLFIM